MATRPAASDSAPDAKRRQALAVFLRSKRERLHPAERGLAVRRKRRAPGLLREEVAEIAGVSVTWYTWLEQARPTNPSVHVLEGLSEALALTPAERTHLYRLARPDLEPNPAPRGDDGVLEPSLVATLHGLTPHPVYATNARWDVLACNEPATALFGDFAVLPHSERNILHRLLHDAAWRTLFVGWEELVRSAIAQFRATTVHLASDPEFAALVARWESSSGLFAEAWQGHALASPLACRKVLRHEGVGEMSFDYTTFRPESTQADVRFTIYTPANAASAERLARLLAGLKG